MKNKKIWSRLGIVTLTAGAILLSSCSDKAEEHNHKETMANSSSHDMAGHNMKGESVSSDVNLATDDIAYLTQLGLMRGHLRVGYELYQAGHVAHAKTHMKHPKMELYADTVPAFAPRGATGFATELTALANAVEKEQGGAAVDTAYKNVVDAIAKTASFVDEKTLAPSQQLQLVVELLRVAGEEYAIAVIDGKMENAHEYQDAYGFTQISKDIVNNLTVQNEAAKIAQTKALEIINDLSPMWPGLVPPNTLEFKARALYDAASEVESLAIDLK